MVVKTGSRTLKEDNIRWKQNERVPVTSEQIPHKGIRGWVQDSTVKVDFCASPVLSLLRALPAPSPVALFFSLLLVPGRTQAAGVIVSHPPRPKASCV